MADSNKHCPNCGAPVADVSCPYCGTVHRLFEKIIPKYIEHPCHRGADGQLRPSWREIDIVEVHT